MPFFRDTIYILFLPVLLIYVVLSRLRGHPPRKGVAERLGYGKFLTPHPKRILLHAVSVGEVNAIKSLCSDLQKQGYEVVICVTTDTGISRANELYSQSCTVTRYPFDFSCAVKRFLNRIQPTIVALVELEVWPNFVSGCSQRNIPIVIINGRLSERSFKRYKLARLVLKSTFKRITAIGMQNESYAQRVRTLGSERVSVHGTMKWDNAIISDHIPGDKELAEALHIDRNKPLVVAGSTTPEEHLMLKECVPIGVQLLCAPRRPEWFDAAAIALSPCNRRTSEQRTDTDYFLLDTIGELDKAYSLADIVVIGRSFVPLHGSDPTVPIALGKPTIIGKNASDFEDMVNVLVKRNGLIQCTKEELKDKLQLLLEDSDLRESLGTNGRAVIQEHQGATTCYEELIMEHTPDA
ncbi:MAG: hypothetical protein HOC27_05690 [Phycisphaerae bacterium]|jgi:3-deoxy-D-manno-octulosonic-acid transferase|nr:hypothetical protein [Phycisphaerae bacterium]